MRWGRIAIAALTGVVWTTGAASENGRDERPQRNIHLNLTLEDSLRLPITAPDVEWRIAVQRDASDHRDGFHVPQSKVVYFNDPSVARRLNGKLGVPMEHQAYFVFNREGNQVVPKDFMWASCIMPRRYWTDANLLGYDLKNRRYAKLEAAHEHLETCFSRLPEDSFNDLDDVMKKYQGGGRMPGWPSCISSGFSMDELFCLMSGLSGCSFSGGDPKMMKKPVQLPHSPFTLGKLFNYNIGDRPVIVDTASVSLCR
ncbi:MAG: hypothetical protein AABX70_04925 [Nanoarchaeota archaeon]